MYSRVREMGKIGKASLITALGIQENYKYYEYEEVENESQCVYCELKKVALENDTFEKLVDFCNNNCSKRKKIVRKVKYFNERNRLKINPGFPVKERLSRLQLLQLIVYHFLGVDNNGIVKNISTKEVSRMLSCTNKTVKNNNERLSELGYIMYSNSISDGSFNIGLNKYKDYFLSQREGGAGYIVMNKDLLNEIVTVDSVNGLRVLLRQLLAFDNTNHNPEEVREARYTYGQYKNFLPNHLNYKQLIDDEIDLTKNVFSVTKYRDRVGFKLNDKYNAKLLSGEIFHNNLEVISKHVDTFNMNKIDIDDLLQMSLSYGIDNIENTLLEIKKMYIDNNEHIFSLGALVRRVLESNISYFSA